MSGKNIEFRFNKLEVERNQRRVLILSSGQALPYSIQIVSKIFSPSPESTQSWIVTRLKNKCLHSF